MQYRKQLNPNSGYFKYSCDLLEKSYFCSIANNSIPTNELEFSVVICLKNRTFAVSQTTGVAFKWFYDCCDLLEKSYFCSIANNLFGMVWLRMVVVICLKNRTFAVSQTTNSGRSCAVFCCDLLEKSYFCSIANNSELKTLWQLGVVIYLKNRTFAVSQTTCHSHCSA